jgi:hypothetical protein
MLKLWDGEGVAQNGDGIMGLQMAETFPNQLQLLKLGLKTNFHGKGTQRGP